MPSPNSREITTNKNLGALREPRSSLRSVTFLVVATGLSLVMAACGSPSGNDVAQLGSTTTQAGSTTSPSSSSSSTPQGEALAYSRCMRSTGVANFPGPASGGVLPKTSLQQLGVSSSQFEAAQSACHHLLPTGASPQQEINCLMQGNCGAALVQQMLTAERRYALCMRSHGVLKWPDPTINPQGMPVFNTTEAGISRQFLHSSLFMSPNLECQRAVGGAPVPRE
jgi:hypothetical protein